ncbi:MAG: bifunctional 5,10-methylenetetrahydrofolate dehydrogenase/5,10-methenyltetrahydrofolate cyclohydrolase [bacterium]|nr:bifunctional 5,10-methylenetetrahydrofolate dehydrogenase/5,10-methenyltetrahydrofolate cyclohydrolase [bacterium]
MTEILDGAGLARTLRLEIAEDVARFLALGARPPGLAAVLVGDNPASEIYVGSKSRAAEAAGFVHRTVKLGADTTQQELEGTIGDLNRDDAVDGILIQLPLPASLRPRQILDRLDPVKDVDGLHAVNVGRLWLDQPGLFPATPSGIVELLDRSGIEIAGKRAVIIGRSHLVGKPLAGLLLRRQATVTVCHSRSQNLAELARQADLLVAAVGKLAMIGPEFVGKGAVVVDVGIHRITDAAKVDELFPGNAARRAAFERKGRIVAGDVDFDRVAPLCSAITPVPGGVGPLTVAMLLANTLLASQRRQGLEVL